MPRLMGERIMLREYRSEDLHAIRSWVNDSQTTRYLSTRFWPPQTAVDSEEFLSRMLQSSHNAFNFVIADAADERETEEQSPDAAREVRPEFDL